MEAFTSPRSDNAQSPRDLQSDATCWPVWESELAQFAGCALPYVTAAPLVFNIIILLLSGLKRLLRPWRPQWTKDFISETPSALTVSRDGVKRTSWHSLASLLALSTLALAALMAQLIVSPRDMSTSILLLSWAITVVMLVLWRPRASPVHLLVFYITMCSVELLLIFSSGPGFGSQDLTHSLSFASAIASAFVVLCMPLRDAALDVEGISAVGEAPSSGLISPEDNLRLWQFLSISWMLPLIQVGRIRTLNEEDVWHLGHKFQHGRLYKKFSALTGTVTQRLLKANGLDVLYLSVSASTETICDYVSPVVLQQLLLSMEDSGSPKRVALTYALFMLALRLITAQAEVFNTWFGRRCYERSRGEMILMCYDKALARKNVIGVDPESFSKRKINVKPQHVAHQESDSEPMIWYRYFHWLQLRSLRRPRPNVSTNLAQPASMGKVLNICRGDVYEVAQRFWELERIIGNVLGLVLSIALVWRLLGPACFIGISTVAAGQVFNVILTRIQLQMVKHGRSATDARLQLTSEYIESIRHLRWYGWHAQWLRQIHEARNNEMVIRVQRMIIQTTINFVSALASGLFPVAALYGYTVLAGNPLSVDLIFPSLQLFGRLSSNLRELPEIITQLINAHVAMARIEEYVNEPDRKSDDIGRFGCASSSIQLDSCTFAWPERTEPILQDLTLKFEPGFHVVHGKVGSGKTALLLGLLGEMDKLSGTAHLSNSMIGYCSQTPWLQSMSIRDNILFSAPYDEWRYRNVIEACQLLPDFAQFAKGDLSAIGENGIGLSGGQKARVALARAVYSQAQVLLLDDPISALDSSTAESIVDKCFHGPLMQGRVVVLVTHRVELVGHIAKQFISIGGGQACVSNFMPGIYVETSPSDSANAPAEGKQIGELGVNLHRGSTDMTSKFEDEEHRSEFGVKARVYWRYIQAGKLRWWISAALALLVWRISEAGQTWYLKVWGESYRSLSHGSLSVSLQPWLSLYPPGSVLSSASEVDYSLRGLPCPEDDVRPWLIAYFWITIWIAFTSWFAQLFLVMIMYISAKTLFSVAITRVSEANFRFYDVTPIGRLMNRLTSDIGTIDSGIAQQFHVIIFQAITWITSLALIGSITPVFLVFSICFVAFTVWNFKLFLPTSQSLRRLETVSLSPLFANFGELLNGLVTVRAFQAEHRFLDRIIRVVDKFQGMDHFYWTLQNWLAFRLQSASSFAVFVLTVIALYTNISPGLTAFVLTSASQFVRSTHVLCRRLGALQMDFVSVERIDELLELEAELSGDCNPPAMWPVYGSDIVLENVTVRYAPHLAPALEDISIRIPGGSTTAILGRTGSGKSTLAVTLLNVIRPDRGSITIDGLDIKTLKVQALRERMTFVAQDPVLFPGSIRHNLDPLEHHTDEECMEVLQHVCGHQGWCLQTNVEGGGRNFSQGQRQLIGLARAVIRRSSIVILDEATASIDYSSSMQIQRILREQLKETTVITIAHRLQAVRDADYVVTLDQGRVQRQGRASEMLNISQS